VLVYCERKTLLSHWFRLAETIKRTGPIIASILCSARQQLCIGAVRIRRTPHPAPRERGRERELRQAQAAKRIGARSQARPMGEGRQCDARGPMALGAHEYTYM